MSTKIYESRKNCVQSGHIDFYLGKYGVCFFILPIADGGIAAGFPESGAGFISM
jgi:hypothetical protein